MNNQAMKSGPGFMGQLDSGVSGFIDRIQVNRSVGRMLLILILTFAFFAALRPSIFLNPINLQNIGVSSPEIGLLALAIMVAMLTGGIDLSVVTIANATAITISSLYTFVLEAYGEGATTAFTPVIVIVGFLVGLALGAFNGFLVSVLGITPILATLGTLQLYNGLALVWTNGVTISGAPEPLVAAGSTAVLGVPVLMWVFILVAIALAVLLNRTPLGKKIQLQGANPLASKYSGISTRKTLMLTYITSGALASIAGIFFISRNPSASADYGTSYLLLAIVIVVLGGTNPNGGFATVFGVILATVTLQVVSSGFTALRLSTYQYAIAQGVILIAVMILDQVSQRRRERRGLRKAMASVGDHKDINASTNAGGNS